MNICDFCKNTGTVPFHSQRCEKPDGEPFDHDSCPIECDGLGKWCEYCSGQRSRDLNKILNEQKWINVQDASDVSWDSR